MQERGGSENRERGKKKRGEGERDGGRQTDTLVLTVDFFFLVSTFTKGEQMVPVLNEVGVHCAVLGNHDFGKFPSSPLLVLFGYFFEVNVLLLLRSRLGSPVAMGESNGIPLVDVQRSRQRNWPSSGRGKDNVRCTLGWSSNWVAGTRRKRMARHAFDH